MFKPIRNTIFALITATALMGCAHTPHQQIYTMACDANGNPVLVTAG